MPTKCFECGELPSVWLKVTETPILNGATKDPHVPFNYIGVWMFACV